jgi:hypothetical protein
VSRREIWPSGAWLTFWFVFRLGDRWRLSMGHGLLRKKAKKDIKKILITG